VVNPEGSEGGEGLEAQALANEELRLLGVEGKHGTRPRAQVRNEIRQRFVRGLPRIVRDQQSGEPIDVTHVHLI
jgi:hypothetical protein